MNGQPNPSEYDRAKPWNQEIRGDQILPLINSDASIIRVESGPGTGKTTGLVRRVQRLLHPDGLNLPGADVLVIAFNRVIAKNLKIEIDNRLRHSPHNGDPEIRTVHALCLRAIGGDLRLLLPHEREAMLYDVLEEFPMLRERFVRHSAIEQALQLHEAKHREDNELWQAVFHWLTRHNARLISELPGLLLDSIRLGDYADLQYQHVIVDEFQDLTLGEQELFFKLRKSDGVFVALGDPRQSIYAFRGNDREGLRKLSNLATEVEEDIIDVQLPECQRCPTAIVNAANSLMAQYPPPMSGGTTEHANIHVVVWDSPVSEASGMARAIIECINRWPNERHLAMVTRRKFGYLLREELLRLNPNLSVDLSFSETLLETWPVRESFLFVSLLADQDAPTWRAWLGYKNSATGEDYAAQRRNADAYLRFLADCDDEITETKVLALASRTRRPQGQGATQLWERTKRYAELRQSIEYPPSNATDFITQLLAGQRWISSGATDENIAQSDLTLLLNKAVELIREKTESHPATDPQDLLRFAIRQLRYQIATREPFVPSDETQLQITTLWGAKGVTAEHVYILGLCNEAVPGDYRKDYPGTRAQYVEEQRRLLYVSLTRAKKTLVISRARQVTRGQARRIGLAIRSDESGGSMPSLHRSVFLSDVIKFLPDAVRGEEWSGCIS